MFQKFSASDVTNMDTLQETVQPRRREYNMLAPLKLTQIHLKRVKRRERKNISSKRHDKKLGKSFNPKFYS
jgi:hypothetical protein